MPLNKHCINAAPTIQCIIPIIICIHSFHLLFSLLPFDFMCSLHFFLLYCCLIGWADFCWTICSLQPVASEIKISIKNLCFEKPQVHSVYYRLKSKLDPPCCLIKLKNVYLYSISLFHLLFSTISTIKPQNKINDKMEWKINWEKCMNAIFNCTSNNKQIQIICTRWFYPTKQAFWKETRSDDEIWKF